MKVQVRQGVFETNSSSTHAICIYRNYEIDGVTGHYGNSEEKFKLPYTEHKLYFGNTGEFGWENKHYHKVEDKASYLWQCIVGCNLVDKLKNRITSVLKKYNIVAQFAPTEKRTYESVNGEVHTYDAFVGSPDIFSGLADGYVDHCYEAAEMITAIVFNDRYLMNYLFNEDSFIATGNDNDDNLTLDDPKTSNCDLYRLATFFKGN